MVILGKKEKYDDCKIKFYICYVDTDKNLDI